MSSCQNICPQQLSAFKEWLEFHLIVAVDTWVWCVAITVRLSERRNNLVYEYLLVRQYKKRDLQLVRYEYAIRMIAGSTARAVGFLAQRYESSWPVQPHRDPLPLHQGSSYRRIYAATHRNNNLHSS